MADFTVISFFTPDWKYPEYAKNLANDCTKLGLEFVIEPKDGTNSYVGNCNLKSNFIRDKLRELKRPVLWLDVDGSVLKIPNELNNLEHYDIAGYANKQFLDRISVNVLLFNYTSNTFAFLDTWCEYVHNSIDDGAFNRALDTHNSKITFELLPGEQVALLTSRDVNIPVEACFINRLSASDLKWQYKNKVENRR